MPYFVIHLKVLITLDFLTKTIEQLFGVILDVQNSF